MASGSGPPLKEKRKICYAARDAFFKCLDSANDDLHKCKATYEVFENDCPKVWIKHFEQTRISKKLQDAQLVRANAQFPNVRPT